MVYCGKPAKGCEACRTRRIKCDQIRPACSQCSRARRQCGYRNLTDSIFRNQTEYVVQKSRQSEAKKSKHLVVPSSPSSGASPLLLTDSGYNSDADLSEFSQPDNLAGLTLDLSQKITFSLDSQATSFFMKNYVIGNSRSFEYLQSFYNSGMPDHLATSVNAVALATFSSEAQSWELEKKATRVYGAALHLLNAALQSPDVACNDSTLISVILLDQFEKIMSRNHQLPIKSRTNHINGATSLVRLRGCEQFQSELGLRIFLQISSAVMVSCMQDGVAVPADIVALRDYATNFLDADDPVWRISQTFVRLVNLYAALKDGTLFHPAAIITAATHLDEDCMVLLTDLGAKMPYTTIHTGISQLSLSSTSDSASGSASLSYEGYFHVYDSYRMAQAWNSVRLGRVLLNEIIRKHYTKAFSSSPDAFLSSQHTARFQRATDNIVEMSSQICATVPQFTSGIPAQAEDGTQPDLEARAADQAATPLTVAGAYSLLFPLFVVGSSPTAPARQRAWILNRVDFVALGMQIRQAQVVAEVLRQREEEINVWDIYAMLGSYVYPDLETR